MGMKFIRGLIYPSTAISGGRGALWRMKWIYEFWGFCINGTSSTTVPGGFAANNGVVMPVEFTTSSTYLLASGTDGAHNAVVGDAFSGDCILTATLTTPFTQAMVGKALVLWKPNSNSSEDSIYLITRVLSSNQLVFNCNTGGTPNPTTKHPSMTSRTNVNYRIVDMQGSVDATLPNANGKFMVLETDAGSINPGQANSQIQLCHQYHTGNNATNQGNTNSASLATTLSGTQSWSGSTLTVSTTTGAGVSPIVVTTSTPHGLTTGQTVTITGVGGNTNANGCFVITSTGTNTFALTQGLTGTDAFTINLPLGATTGNGTYTSGGTVYNGFQNDGYAGLLGYGCQVFTGSGASSGQTGVTMIGDKTFLIAYIKEEELSGLGTAVGKIWIHFEIPTRLYPQGQDMHPVALMCASGSGYGVSTSGTASVYGGGFTMRTHSSDTTTLRKYRTLVKSLRGEGLPDVFGQNLSNYLYGYNTIAGTVPVSDAILCLPSVANQYQLGRVRLRTVRFTGTHIPVHHRIGLNGEFIQVANGVCWPWDNTIQVNQLFPFS